VERSALSAMIDAVQIDHVYASVVNEDEATGTVINFALNYEREA
jgi:hypothetical protein